MNMSLMEILWGETWVVRFVLLSLILASVYSWAIIFAKKKSFKKANKDTKAFLDYFWKGDSLDSIYSESKNYSESPVCNVFRSTYQEFQKLAKKNESGTQTQKLMSEGVENIERTLRKARMNEGMRMESRLPSLATIASATPFIGLLGTVWGIMNSFFALGQGGPATLERVAPGISEALIATAIGLMAAIPAVIYYNHYLGKVRECKVDMDNFATDFLNIIKRSYID